MDPGDIRIRSWWLLLALRAAGEQGLTPVQLQKALFVLGARRPQDVAEDFYSFQAYHYGPFDAAVYWDADILASDSLLFIDESKGRSLRTYRLTPEGAALADQVKARVSQQGVLYLEQVVEWALRLSFDQLIRSIYQAFPEMRANSVFRETA